jgi:hypothetical protein
MNARVAGLLNFTLARLAFGAVPVDGWYGSGVRPRRRAVTGSGAREPEQKRRPGLSQFVRGLS